MPNDADRERLAAVLRCEMCGELARDCARPIVDFDAVLAAGDHPAAPSLDDGGSSPDRLAPEASPGQ